MTVEQIEEARRIVPIVSVQNKFSISDRSMEDVLNYCTQNNIAFIPHGSLGAHPLKQGAPLANAEGIIADIAQKKGVKSNQIALAWLLHYAPNIILIPGTTTIAHLEENIAVNSIHLSTDEINLLDQIDKI